MDDTQPDIGTAPKSESEQTSSELNLSEPIVSIVATVESTPMQALPTNGSSPRKIAANRRNAQKSTGPKTPRGKSISSWNSTRHGLLSNRLPLLYGRSKKHFTRLLRSLQQDLEPVGTLEGVLVEKIAHGYWRIGVAAFHEAQDLSEASPFKHIDRPTRALSDHDQSPALPGHEPIGEVAAAPKGTQCPSAAGPRAVERYSAGSGPDKPK